MRVTARADYALRAAIELAAPSGSHVTGELVVRAQNIPGNFIETILTQLRRTGLVRVRRGPDGGFRLARPASEISLADIIRAVDGQFPSARGEPPDSRRIQFLRVEPGFVPLALALRSREGSGGGQSISICLIPASRTVANKLQSLGDKTCIMT